MFNVQYSVTNGGPSKIDGLRSRIKKYILEVVSFAREVHRDEVGRVLLGQLIRAVTSIGANFEEATETRTNRDLVYKLAVSRKETKETIFWLDLVGEIYPQLKGKGERLIQEGRELVMIFSSIISKKEH